MAAFYLPTLCCPAPTPYLYASRRSGQTISSSSTAAACRRCRASHRIQATAGNGTKHSAWTSIRQERWEGDLAIEGHIPAWLKGTYLRNGPGVWEVGDHAFDHVFDGYATLVRVSFDGAGAGGGRATGAHRQIESDAYKAATAAAAHGRLPVMREFSQLCPSEPGSLVDRLRNAAGIVSGAAMSDNPNTAVLPLGDGRVVCLSEVTKSSVLVDPATLGTLGKLRYADTLPSSALQCTHPVVTTTTAGAGAGGEVLTLVPDFARRGYVVARMTSDSDRREVIGRVRCRGAGSTPAWVHSFAVTDKYVVVPEMPVRYSVGPMLMSQRTPLYLLDWLPDSGSYMHVVCRSTGNTVASVEVPPFVAFHLINAYEAAYEEKGAVIVDCCEYYADPTIIQALTLHRLRSPETANDFLESRVARFRIPLDGSGAMGEVETVVDPDEHGRGVELSTINPAYVCKEYRYLYACSARRPCNFFNALSKMDLVEKKATNWHEEGTVPSEPFFVPRPGATNEDDGVVISTASTMDGEGYVLLLDAATFKEIARLRLPYGLPFGFHGCWIPDNN